MDRPASGLRRILGTSNADIQLQISNEGILVTLLVGLAAGWLAGKIVRDTGFGILGDIIELQPAAGLVDASAGLNNLPKTPLLGARLLVTGVNWIEVNVT